MEFLKAGEPVESNIFNQLDEKKRALIDKGVDVINLSIGTPDFQPDKHVMEAVSRAALDPDMYKYSLTETPELLDAVEKWYKRRYDVDLSDDEIIQVSGSQEGFAHIRRPERPDPCTGPGLPDLHLWSAHDRCDHCALSAARGK